MKEKILKYTIFITGFICLYAFISIRIFPMYNITLVEKLIPGYWDHTKYGELYYFNFIKKFREENLPEANIKHQYSTAQANINDTDIFTFGDSFFDISRPIQYSTVLANTLNKKIHFGYNDFPLQYLEANGYKGKDPKVLILAFVERFIPIKFAVPRDTVLKIKKQLPPLTLSAKKVKDFIFYSKSEQMYDALLKRSYLTTAAYTEIASKKFNWFSYISKYTPVYYLKDSIPWLFIDDEVDGRNTSFYYHFTDSEIENISNNIADLSKKLKKKYNITFVFLPLPAKYTLYHTKFNNDNYNQFIPRLQQSLTNKGVAFVDIYSKFKNSDQTLYYGTDAHWNDKGMRTAVNLTITYLKENNLINIK